MSVQPKSVHRDPSPVALVALGTTALQYVSLQYGE